jgi:hypothetical protein
MGQSDIGIAGVPMLRIHAAPLLLSLLVGSTLGLAAWGFVRRQDREASIVSSSTSDRLLIGLLTLAAFALGALVTYLLLIVAVR